jgi:DNA modification methylase
MTLYKGDCLEVMKLIPDGSIDAIITDPPYGTTACKWDSVIPFEPMWEQLNRIIKPNGAIVLFGSEPFSSALRMSNIKNYKYDIVWQKEQPSNWANSKKQIGKVHEVISIFYKKQCLYNPQMRKGFKPQKSGTFKKPEHMGKTGLKVYGLRDGANDRYPISVIKFNRARNGIHPTQKPVALMEYLIKTYTNENETVLDFTMGSGTTGVAAKNLNRKFIGIEQDENYFKVAEERINKQEKQLKIL